jgi:ribosomal protein S18 acetylase RimI-like enzyme
MLREAAEIDRRSFSRQWANDRAALDEITAATPHHRSRSIHVGRQMAAFSISGRADRAGYVQRLVVDPSARRQGFARLLLDDALDWMRRRDVTRVLVNTASDNEAALTLYRSAGFEDQPGALVILERALR